MKGKPTLSDITPYAAYDDDTHWHVSLPANSEECERFVLRTLEQYEKKISSTLAEYGYPVDPVEASIKAAKEGNYVLWSLAIALANLYFVKLGLYENDIFKALAGMYLMTRQGELIGLGIQRVKGGKLALPAF